MAEGARRQMRGFSRGSIIRFTLSFEHCGCSYDGPTQKYGLFCSLTKQILQSNIK